MPEEALTASLAKGLRAGDRRSLARSITLIESRNHADRIAAATLLREISPFAEQSLRIGVSGAPGVGKSTFIEAFGLHLIDNGHRVAVLAIDPSSTLSGGSILGDKTRMERLSTHDSAFIRPTPSSGTLGGVAERSSEVVLLCEAAGFDIVIIETVGVGQSEVAVAGLTDLLLLLQLPNAGDDLQAIKRGVVELADFVAINKSDLDPDAASRAAYQIRTRFQEKERVYCVSARTGNGIAALWEGIKARAAELSRTGELSRRREAQVQSHSRNALGTHLIEEISKDPDVLALLPELLSGMGSGALSAHEAAEKLLALYQGSRGIKGVK